MKPTASSCWLLRRLKREIQAIEISGVAPAHLLRVRVTLVDEKRVLTDTAGSAPITAGEQLALQAAKHRISGALLVLMSEIDAGNERAFSSELRTDLWLATGVPAALEVRIVPVFDLAPLFASLPKERSQGKLQISA